MASSLKSGKAKRKRRYRIALSRYFRERMHVGVGLLDHGLLRVPGYYSVHGARPFLQPDVEIGRRGRWTKRGHWVSARSLRLGLYFRRIGVSHFDGHSYVAKHVRKRVGSVNGTAHMNLVLRHMGLGYDGVGDFVLSVLHYGFCKYVRHAHPFFPLDAPPITNDFA